MLARNKKIIYLIGIGFLTSTALSAAYWQTNRYFQSRKRWDIIKNELSKTNPDSLSNLTQKQIFPLKYVQVYGTISQKIMLISRSRDSRMGNLVVRALEFGEGQNRKTILVVQGWIPDGYQYKPKSQTKKFVGIIRQKQRTDYVHKKMKQSDIQKFNINTYINVQKSITQFNLQNKNIITDYYLQILRDPYQKQETISQTNVNVNNVDKYYPYQYSVDNFQLPYLTPDKHRAYATFWTLTSVVGISAMVRVIRMK